MTYGYVRVSTKDQCEDRQLAALKRAGVTPSLIFADKQSGKDFNRPQWRKLTKKLIRGDILVVTSIDRFGRNYNEIIEQWRKLVKIKGVHIKVLDMPLLDTTAAQGLLSVFIGDLVLQILSFVAQTEREHIKARQSEGIAAAKARGVKFGRPRKGKPDNINELIIKVARQVLTTRQAASQAGVSRTTFCRWRREK